MSDQRHQYVAQRLDVALDGVKYSPSIAAFFENNKVQEELARFYSSDGPECITFLVERPEDDGSHHKLTFHAGAPKTSPATRWRACGVLVPRVTQQRTDRPAPRNVNARVRLTCAQLISIRLCLEQQMCVLLASDADPDGGRENRRRRRPLRRDRRHAPCEPAVYRRQRVPPHARSAGALGQGLGRSGVPHWEARSWRGRAPLSLANAV